MNFFQKIPDETIIATYNESESIRDFMLKVGKNDAGGVRNQLKLRFAELDLSWEILALKGKQCRVTNSSTAIKNSEIRPEDLFRSDSDVKGGTIKRRVLRDKLISYECSGENCTLQKEWLGKALVLVMDHINGDPTDHRLENLRFLCPNCNSQTDTFTGRNRRMHPVRIPKMCTNNCGKLALGFSSLDLCQSCAVKLSKPKRSSKIEWPCVELLSKLVWEKPTTALATELGVSDKAIDKHCKKYEITKPSRGYWAKLIAGKL